MSCKIDKGGEAMGSVLSFTQNDPRILKHCNESFPYSPEFAKYLADRVVDLGGSFELVRILCSTLYEQNISRSLIVPAECVQKLSVDHLPHVLGKVNKAYPDKPLRVVSNALVFLMRLDGTVVAPRGARSIHDLIMKPRAAIPHSIDKEAFARLFYCAQAMLAGVDVDPCAQAAA